MTCPLCTIIEEDYWTALSEAGAEEHRADVELLLDYAEEILHTLKRHEQTHAGVREQRPAPRRPE